MRLFNIMIIYFIMNKKIIHEIKTKGTKKGTNTKIMIF